MTQQVPPAPGPLRVEITEQIPLRTDKKQTFLLQAFDYFDNLVPNGIALFPPAVGATSIVANGNGTFTFGRPVAGSSAQYIVEGRAPGYSSITADLHLLPQDPVILSTGIAVSQTSPLVGVTPPASGGAAAGTATLGGYGYASAAEFNADKALKEAMRLALIALGALT